MNKHCQSYMYAQVHDQIIKYIKWSRLPVPLHYFIGWCTLIFYPVTIITDFWDSGVYFCISFGSGNSSVVLVVVECRTHDWKVVVES